MQTKCARYSDQEIETKPVSDDEFEAYMRSDNDDIAIELVEFFLPEFAE